MFGIGYSLQRFVPAILIPCKGIGMAVVVATLLTRT
jgi:hypothetical protein